MMSYRQYTRPLTKQERAFLQRTSMKKQKRELLTSFLRWSCIWLGIIVVLVLVYRLVWHSAVVVVGIFVISIFEFMNLGTLLEWRKYARQSERWRNEHFPDILRDNTVHVTEVHTERMAMYEAEGDERDLMVFDLGEGKLFWMCGQFLFPTFGKKSWPSDHFEVVESKDRAINLGIRSLGKRLKPVRKRSIRELSESGFIELPNEEVVSGSLDDVEKLFVAAK